MADRVPARPRRSPRDWRRLHLPVLTALTAYSTALAWQAQAVSYPLFRAVGEAEFADYHRQYDRAIPWVVVVPGFVSFLAGAAFPWTRPAEVPRPLAGVVGAAGVVSVASTVLRAIPMHDRLDREGRTEETVDRLLRANLVRTLALTTSTSALVAASVRSEPVTRP